jgi:hypothetical protein
MAARNTVCAERETATRDFSSASRMLRMPSEKTNPRRKIRPIVTAVVQPVAKRLARMEALLIEMRHEQDVQLKRSIALVERFETLSEQVRRYRKEQRVNRIRTPLAVASRRP